MTKKTKLTICNWMLLSLTIAILASGLQLEINPFGPTIRVWLHIIVGILFFAGIFRHLSLHHNSGVMKRPKGKHHRNRHPFLGVFLVLTLLSGIIATCHWIGSYIHTTTGGIHGKIGFLFIITIISHIWHNRKFFHRA